MITVFYDGKCGLCRREIEHYMRIAPVGVFMWVDITVTPAPFTTLGYGVNDGLKALHAIDSEGIMHVAVDAFMLIWQQLPRWRMLAVFAKLPIIYPLAAWLYRIFAAWRFKKLGYGACEL
jgi:predicted DCC family thiol-disulfide oxidoreductase YuxK